MRLVPRVDVQAQRLAAPRQFGFQVGDVIAGFPLVGLGLGPLFFGILSDLLQPAYGEDSVRYVLYGATFLGLVPAFFFWRCSLRLNEELDQKD